MIKSRRDSGQSVVIGALLLLALFVAFITWFQFTQVPILNQNAESEHHDMIRSDLVEFQDNSYDTILNDNVHQNSFNTKVTYDFQIAGFQDKIGHFSVVEFDDNPINIRSVDTEVSGLPDSMISFQYNTSYIERSESNFKYEYGALVEDESQIGSDDSTHRFIRGNNIYLFSYDVDFITLQSPNTVLYTVPDSGLETTTISGEEVDVSQEDEDETFETQDIEIEFETTFNIETWESLLSSQEHILDIEGGDSSVTITLDGTEEYTVYTGTAKIEQ